MRAIPQWLFLTGEAHNLSVCSVWKAGTSAVPVWHQQPMEFPEIHWSLVQKQSLKNAGSDISKGGSEQINECSDKWKGQMKKPNNQPFFWHLLFYYLIWPAIRRFHPHLGWVLPHPLRQPGQFSRSSSQVILICGKQTLKPTITALVTDLEGDCGQGTHDVWSWEYLGEPAAAPPMNPSKSWALQPQSRPFSKRKPWDSHVPS